MVDEAQKIRKVVLLPQDSDEVIERMKEYVQVFVTTYHKELKDDIENLEGRIPKRGNTCDLMGEVTGTTSGAYEVLSGAWKAVVMIGLSLFLWVARAVGSLYNRKRLKGLLSVLYYFKKKPDEMRRILVRSAMDVFESYEAQFVRTTADDTWERAMHKLAEDAVDRSLNYFRDNQEEEFSVQSCKRGIVTGTSKIYAHTSTGISKFQSGHTVYTVNNESGVSEEWNTSEIYQKTGIVDEQLYYDNSDEEGAKKFGYRLRLDAIDDISTYSQRYVDEAPRYNYMLNLDKGKKEELERTLIELMVDNNEKILEKLEILSNETKEIRKAVVVWIENERRPKPTSNILFQITPPLKMFSGKKTQLEKINNILTSGTEILVISGLSGVGKTELMLKYLNEFGKNFDGNIVWINVQEEETIRSSLYSPATKIGLDMLDKSGREKKLDLILDEVYGYFANRNGKSLFIFDNADNKSIKPLLPKFCKGVNVPQIVIMSTNAEWENDRYNMEVYRLNFELEECIKILRNALKIEDRNCKKLSNAQNNLSLTLHEATSSYIGEERNKSGLLNKNSFTVSHPSQKQIKSEEAVKILNILAYFSSEPVYKSLIINLPESDIFLSIIQLLENYSNITQYVNGMTIYDLTQQHILRIGMEDLENPEKDKKVNKCLGKALNQLKTVMKNDKIAEMYSSHIKSVWSYTSKYYDQIKGFVGIDVDATQSNFIHFIAKRSHNEIFEEIVSKITETCPEKLKFIANVRDKDGWTPLHLAAKNGQYEIVETLLLYKAGIDDETGSKFTPLHLAAVNRHPKIVKLLITNNADLNVRNYQGNTPLHIAVKNNDLETVEHILSKPECIQTLQVEDNKGLQPLSIAVRFADFSIVKLLLDRGAKVDDSANFTYGSSALYFAAKRADFQILGLILGNTTCTDVVDDRGYTPLQFAMKMQKYGVTKILL